MPRGAKPVSSTLHLDTRIPAWHSTGLYAAPGKVITVTLPPAAVDKGLTLRIGCHSDALWGLDSWRRMPEVCRTWPLREPATEAASSLGGLIYLDVPTGCSLGTLDVTIRGAVAAPLFVLDTTTRADWVRHIRSRPAPWAELATSKLILTVPSRVIRTLDDPEALLRLWDQVLDADADLARIPHERARPERFVLDEQISAGYMHSGYPIMAHLDVERAIVTAEKIAKGEDTWGYFHEIGHNHQSGDWTFDGTGDHGLIATGS